MESFQRQYQTSCAVADKLTLETFAQQSSGSSTTGAAAKPDT